MAIVASLFGELAEGQNLQALIDDQKQLLYGRSVWRNYLDWGIPQTELTFATAIGRSRIEAAASIVDPDASAPLRGTNKLEKLEGKIPTMKEKFSLNQDDYRKLRSLQSLPISDEQKLRLLIEKLWNVVENASTSTDRRIDIMLFQGMSNFSIDVNVLNNPDGLDFGSVDLLAKADQKRTVSVVWTDQNADPFKDIEDVVTYAAASGRTFSKILIDREKWVAMKNLPKVKSAISALYNPGSNKNYVVTLNSVNEYLIENQLPVIEIVNVRYGIEKDGIVSTINPFNKENIVFIPDGKLGIVHNAVSIENWEPVQGINYANYDRTLISQWRDNDPWREYTQAELNAFPALEQIDRIFLLQTNVATT